MAAIVNVCKSSRKRFVDPDFTGNAALQCQDHIMKDVGIRLLRWTSLPPHSSQPFVLPSRNTRTMGNGLGSPKFSPLLQLCQMVSIRVTLSKAVWATAGCCQQ